jgi:hypothetical protein
LKSPNINLPNEELRKAIFVRLDGNIFRLNGTTPLPVYDEIPEDFRDFDFLEIDTLDGEPGDPNPSLYMCEIVINVFSTYAGYKELSRELNQVHAFLGSELRTMTGFTDVSQGGMFIRVMEMKRDSDEGTIVRHGMYRRRYTIADNKL